MEIPQRRHYTPREAAALLGITTHTLARYAREGRIDVIVFPGGHHRRYPIQGVEAFLERHTQRYVDEPVESS
jgi:excisionase family DNA binding protein